MMPIIKKVILIFILFVSGCTHSKYLVREGDQIFFDNAQQMEEWISEHPKVKIAWVYKEALMIQLEDKK